MTVPIFPSEETKRLAEEARKWWEKVKDLPPVIRDPETGELVPYDGPNETSVME